MLLAFLLVFSSLLRDMEGRKTYRGEPSDLLENQLVLLWSSSPIGTDPQIRSRLHHTRCLRVRGPSTEQVQAGATLSTKAGKARLPHYSPLSVRNSVLSGDLQEKGEIVSLSLLTLPSFLFSSQTSPLFSDFIRRYGDVLYWFFCLISCLLSVLSLRGVLRKKLTNIPHVYKYVHDQKVYLEQAYSASERSKAYLLERLAVLEEERRHFQEDFPLPSEAYKKNSEKPVSEDI